MSGTETEDLDAGLLVAARSGELDAIATVCSHYRGRLMSLATNAGAEEPETVVQRALTEALLQIEPVDSPSLADFERRLFNGVVVDNDPVDQVAEVPSEALPESPTAPDSPTTPAPPTLPAPPAHPAVNGAPTSIVIDTDDADGTPVPGLAALADPALGVDTEPVFVEPALFDPSITADLVEAELSARTAAAAAVAGTATDAPTTPDAPTADAPTTVSPVPDTTDDEPTEAMAVAPLLSEQTGPVDWSALAGEQAPAAPVLVAPSNRVVAGGAALFCGVGLLAAILIFFGGDDDTSTDGAPDAAVEAPGEPTPDSGSGPEPAAPEVSDQNRSSGTVSDTTPDPNTSTTVEPTSTTAASSSTTETTVSTTASTAPPSTPAPTTTQPSTTSTTVASTSSTFAGPRPGDFSGESLDNRTFQGSLIDHDFTGATLSNVDFRGADLRGVSFNGVTLRNVRFLNSDLSGADFRGADMDNTTFNRNTNISDTDFRNSVLPNGTFNGFSRPGQDPIGLPDGVESDDDDDD